MQVSDYPWVFFASDMASARAQRQYFWVLKIQLSVFLIVSAIAGTAAVLSPSSQRILSICNAVLLALAVMIVYVMRERRYEKTWFDLRAVAESVKTATWRYMMNVNPFTPSMADDVADPRFIHELKEIQTLLPGNERALVGVAQGQKHITDFMRATRQKTCDERLAMYIQERLLDQQAWYQSKSHAHTVNASIWYWVTGVFQALALVIAIIAAAIGPFKLDAVSILMTVAASFTALGQASRDDELAASYALASQELGQLEALSAHAKDQPSLETLVETVEGAISREHTGWVAKRASP